MNNWKTCPTHSSAVQIVLPLLSRATKDLSEAEIWSRYCYQHSSACACSAPPWPSAVYLYCTCLSTKRLNGFQQILVSESFVISVSSSCNILNRQCLKHDRRQHQRQRSSYTSVYGNVELKVIKFSLVDYYLHKNLKLKISSWMNC